MQKNAFIIAIIVRTQYSQFERGAIVASAQFPMPRAMANLQCTFYTKRDTVKI